MVPSWQSIENCKFTEYSTNYNVDLKGNNIIFYNNKWNHTFSPIFDN